MKKSLIGALCAMAVAGSAFAQTPKKPPATPSAKAVTAMPAGAKDAATLEFEKFRTQMEQDGNPAELFEVKGEDLWKAKRGPKNVSLAETCDLGLGLGKVKGAYVQMPRYFADADKVMDAERRIVWCMVEKQGFKFDELNKKPFASGEYTPEPTSLVTYVAGQSKDMKFAVPAQGSARQGRRMKSARKWWHTAPARTTFPATPATAPTASASACRTCRISAHQRVRTLPCSGWPGYRMTGGVMLTLQWRMGDCFRQQRFPQPGYASDTITALLTYMTANANGQVYKGLGIKR